LIGHAADSDTGKDAKDNQKVNDASATNAASSQPLPPPSTEANNRGMLYLAWSPRLHINVVASDM
jgi:hypothetical protein